MPVPTRHRSTGDRLQLLQSKYAVGSGQLFGKGLFPEGTQTSFEYVPEQETDFIFTAVASSSAS